MRITRMVVKGVPYSRWKKRGNRSGLKKWVDEIISQTINIRQIDYPCSVNIIFILPKDKYPTDFPYGPDLDNYIKPVLDAFQRSKLLKNDSLIIKLMAEKRKSTVSWTGIRVVFRQLPAIKRK